ncbi:MAG: sugar transferase [Thermoleophilaceae bacterium]|nr:sugar transferase [Thermoleophilaceae bacterium]
MRRALAAADVLALIVGFAAALGPAGTRADFGYALLLGLATVPGWITIFRVYRLYEGDLKRVNHAALDDAPALFHALVIGSLLTWIVFRIGPVEQLSAVELATFGVVSFCVVLGFRTAARRLVGRLLGPERVLVVGHGPTASLLIRKMAMHPENNLRPVGAITSVGAHELQTPAGSEPVRVLGTVESSSLEEIAEVHKVERVILSHTDLPETTMLDFLWRCKQLSLKVSVLPQLFDAMGPSVEIDSVEGITLLGINPPVLGRSSRLLKRSMDLLLATSALIVTAPLLLLAAVAIRIDSKGPVLFRQTRVGRRAEPFELLKFRTMRAGAEREQAGLMGESSDPNWVLIADDPRITRVGQFLRSWSLDELPQFWNVVKGQMTLVGPRPLIESEDSHVDGWGRTRLDLMPGITGLWQVLGRTTIPFEEMVKLDYLYVTNWSLWTDIKLLIQTFGAVFLRRGVN